MLISFFVEANLVRTHLSGHVWTDSVNVCVVSIWPVSKLHHLIQCHNMKGFLSFRFTVLGALDQMKVFELGYYIDFFVADSLHNILSTCVLL